MNCIKNKNGISPVVATALLLVVAVLAVVGFQGWFTSFSSGVLVGVESDSQTTNSQIKVEELVGDILYINSGNNLSINSINIGGVDCNINGSYSGLVKIDVSACIENITGSANIVVVTGDKVLDSYQYLEGATSSGAGGSASCLLDGNTVLNGNTSTFYDSQFSGSCDSLVRTCSDGSLSGSALFMYSNCVIDSLGWTYINTCTDLQNMRDNLTDNYQLTQNIDCSGITNFEPVGGSDVEYYSGVERFFGNFEGNQFTISNLTINRALDGAGLFSRSDGNISNLKIINANVTTSANYAGILSGVKRGGDVRQVMVSGIVNGASDVGGIIGRMGEGDMINSYSLGTVIGTQTVGGLVGMNYKSITIRDSFTAASVSSTGNYVGGLSGSQDQGDHVNTFVSNSASGVGGSVGGVTGWINSGSNTNVYWNNKGDNPATSVGTGSTAGITTISDNEAHFYSGSNAPMSSWDSNWTFSGTGFPKLSFE